MKYAIKHFTYKFYEKDFSGKEYVRKVYLCNWACGFNSLKAAENKDEVTCKNCLRKLKGGDKNEYN